MKCLENYDWPGNVRELENAIERALALEISDMISVESLPEKVTHLPQRGEFTSLRKSRSTASISKRSSR